ncbi:MAG: helix-turn-helix transcriptional regulator [Desulfovibrio sp.]|uniref:helix-turn-helix domain-containing protein n=1 Tax=Desulfovibrio sp. TaxID=885 RepID=UPI00135E0CDC|nr:helix-turn-helix transcriptional regulator [Desulfovibrio sp.]MTJ94340.1 helix-turn-helix transcriptional regulator [Desulfovibrio sp.]
MSDKHTFGLRIRAIRKEHGFTQEQLAEILDRSVDTISKMERGITFPGCDTLIRISETFSIPLDVLSDWFASSSNNPEPERIVLEARLNTIVKGLSLRNLRIAVEQVSILAQLADARD